MNERLVAFLSEMVYHHAPVGGIETLVEKAELVAIDQEEPDPFEQSHVERFVRDMAKRLEEESSI